MVKMVKIDAGVHALGGNEIGVQMGEEAFQRILSSSITRIFEVGVA